MRTKAFFSGLVLAAVLVWAFGVAWRARLTPTHKTPVVHTLRGQTMGTTYSIRLVIPQFVPPAQLLQLRRRADRLLEDLNDAMSTYRPHSTIVHFNQSPVTTPVNVGEVMATVVRRGLEIARLTSGAFDIMLDADIDAWGFDVGPRRTRPPQQIRQTRHGGESGQTGLDRVEKISNKVEANVAGLRQPELRLQGNLLRKRDPRTRLNLSGIAKGYGVDRLANLVASMGFGRFMVEIGGEVRVRGTNQIEGLWRIAIEAPVSLCHLAASKGAPRAALSRVCHPRPCSEPGSGSGGGQAPAGALPGYACQACPEAWQRDDRGGAQDNKVLCIRSDNRVPVAVAVLRSGQALATSGTTRNAFIHNGRIYSHILDPRTRAPVRTTLVSVSIVANDCMTADALATAAMVLGESETRAVLKRFSGAHALFVHVDPVTGETNMTYTSGFPLKGS